MHLLPAQAEHLELLAFSGDCFRLSHGLHRMPVSPWHALCRLPGPQQRVHIRLACFAVGIEHLRGILSRDSLQTPQGEVALTCPT